MSPLQSLACEGNGFPNCRVSPNSWKKKLEREKLKAGVCERGGHTWREELVICSIHLLVFILALPAMLMHLGEVPVIQPLLCSIHIFTNGFHNLYLTFILYLKQKYHLFWASWPCTAQLTIIYCCC